MHLAALQAERLKLLPGDVGLGEQPLGLAVEAGQRGLGLCLLRCGSAQMRCTSCMVGAAVLLGLLLGGGNGADGLLRLLLMGLRGFARAGGLGGGIFEEAAVLLELAGERWQAARAPARDRRRRWRGGSVSSAMRSALAAVRAVMRSSSTADWLACAPASRICWSSV